MAFIKPRNFKSKTILQQVSKEQFLSNIKESRLSEGIVEHFDFNKGRCKLLTEHEHMKDNTGGVLYWMMRDCRIQDNWAMIFAQRLAIKRQVPLYVCFTSKNLEHLYPTKRHFKFLVEGLQLIKKECAELNIGFYIVNSSPQELVDLVISNNIGGVICDFYPLKYPKKLHESFLQELPDDVPVVQVDAHNIVPAWLASDKLEGMARFLRPKITKHLPVYLTDFPIILKHEYSGRITVANEIKNVEQMYDIYTPKWDVPEIKWGEGAGEEAGLSMLLYFMQNTLQYYGISSNDPSKDHTSKLSPWLNYGHISAQRVALEIKGLETVFKDQCEKYLEELIIRKELADNFCFYNNFYDSIKGATNWAQESLKIHEKDKRIWIYTRDQLEKGETHDEMWNAAQLQAVQEGKIHGYMRMYWCKKILEWTESPEQAIEFGLWLNDTFCLDGTDPNGYVGVMWSICGVHDQGWKERDIFGKIRYMVDYSLRRKFNMNEYCGRFGRELNKKVQKEVKEKEPKKTKRKAVKRKPE